MDDEVPAKVLTYKMANRAVATLCNHQRTVPKKQMETIQTKVYLLAGPNMIMIEVSGYSVYLHLSLHLNYEQLRIRNIWHLFEITKPCTITNIYIYYFNYMYVCTVYKLYIYIYIYIYVYTIYVHYICIYIHTCTNTQIYIYIYKSKGSLC